MGKEEVYKVTLDIKGKDGAEGPGANDEEKDDTTEEEETGEHEEEEQEAAEDEEDAFAMMAGMGEEEVYKVTLDIKGKEGAECPEAVEEEEDNKVEAEETGDHEEDEAADVHDPVPESLTSNKNFEKKNKKVTKEGGKRGVEIEGAADMGGLQFFCTSVEEPVGDVDWLYESLRAMNAKSDPSEEERKGGSGHVGKMLVSINETESCAMVSYVPKKFHGQIQAESWLKDVLKLMGAPDSAFVSGNANTARASIKTDSDKGLFPLKMKDAGISLSIDYLKKRGLFPDKDDDEDDEMVFGDDDFPE